MSGHQQALLSLIANVTQQMQICSRPCSDIGPASGHQLWATDENGNIKPRTTRNTRNLRGSILFAYSAYFAVPSFWFVFIHVHPWLKPPDAYGQNQRRN